MTWPEITGARLRVQPLTDDGIPIGEPTTMDGFLSIGFTAGIKTEDEWREASGFNTDRTFTESIRVTFTDPWVWLLSYRCAIKCAMYPQLALESRAGQQQRVWREYVRAACPPIKLERWLIGDPVPTKWEIAIGKANETTKAIALSD